MMRVTGGFLCGRRLHVPKADIRPTQDRVRESLFAILAPRLDGACFLDLFAGTGAVGLEAWSRGAARICWVESNRQVAALLERNVDSLAPESGRIIRDDALRALRRGVGDAPFDIVYADPPYAETPKRDAAGKTLAARLMTLVGERGRVVPGGLFVLERRARDDCEVPAGWALLTAREYGRTAVSVFEWQGESRQVE